MRAYLFITWAILITACAQQPTNRNQDAGDIAAINQLREQEEEAAEDGNVDSLLALRTDDFIAMPPNQSAVKGKEAMRDFLTGMFSQIEMEETIVSEEITIAGDWAYDRGSFTGTARPKTGGSTISIEGKYLWILKRQTDGSWKYAVHMWSPNTPSSP